MVLKPITSDYPGFKGEWRLYLKPNMYYSHRPKLGHWMADFDGDGEYIEQGIYTANHMKSLVRYLKGDW